MKKIICVLVLYNPDLKLLPKVISSIIPQVDLLWISDNSPCPIEVSFISSSSKVKYEKMPGNIGIAAAQNYGIRYALEKGFDYLYFLDQDSISPRNIIENLKKYYETFLQSGVKVGAVGPRAFNRGENKDYRGMVKKGRRISDDVTEVSELISSASFISVPNFSQVGMMDESLFIDGVDHEWCWRATQKGKFRFFIIESTKLSHQLGEGDRHFLWKKVAIPTPFRTYYQFRNYFILLHRAYVPMYWKFSNGVKYFIKLFYFPLCISPRLEYAKNIWRGIKDGVKSKS